MKTFTVAIAVALTASLAAPAFAQARRPSLGRLAWANAGAACKAISATAITSVKVFIARSHLASRPPIYLVKR